MIVRCGGARLGGWCRSAATLLAILACASKARAAGRGLSDADLIELGYIFLGVPVYGLLMVAALVKRPFEKRASGRTPSRSLRLCANLLPITMAAALLAYKYLARPLLPGHYSDLGFFVTWGCILSPLPLVLAANYVLSRLPRLYQVVSSPWWMALYGAIGAMVVAWMFLSN
jgi:hypothetical protein